MSKVTVYHNPRCTKSRQTLKLLQDNGIDPTVVEYLADPPDAKTLAALSKKLGLPARDMVRRGEQEFKDLGLKEKLDTDAALFAAMAKHPKLIERPIVVCGAKARLGRPPENVLEIL